MRARARWLFRLYAVVALAGLAVALAGLTVVAHATALGAPSSDELLAACRSWLPHLNATDLLVFGLASLASIVIGRAARSGITAHRSTRKYLRALRPCGSLGTSIAACVIADAEPKAFCAGLLRPRIYVSTGALKKLEDVELDAVLAHEAHHASRLDPLRLFVTHVLTDALFFLPVMRALHRRHAALTELAADEAAVGSSGTTQPLASALLAFGQVDNAAVIGVSAERVDNLLGERPQWELPVSLLLAAAVTVAGLGALVIGTARITTMAQVSWPLLLMQSCAPLMLGFAGLVLWGVFLRRSF